MPESIHPTNNPEDQGLNLGRRLPGEQELREFEDVQSIPPMIEYSIEEFAKDPDNPTPEELQALKDLNRGLAGETPTFEEWFGYPDPREPENQDVRGDQQEPGKQDR